MSLYPVALLKVVACFPMIERLFQFIVIIVVIPFTVVGSLAVLFSPHHLISLFLPFSSHIILYFDCVKFYQSLHTFCCCF